MHWKSRACVLTFTISAIYSAYIVLHRLLQKRNKTLWTAGTLEMDVVDGILGLIGNTPLIELKSLSEATGCRILAKAEWLNPGGSGKDRVAKRMVEEAELTGQLKPGGTIYEGTAGSTGISLAMISKVKGYQCSIFIPDDQAIEKAVYLEKLGAKITSVRPASIIDPDQFCNLAKKEAACDPFGFFADQFENLANYRAHYTTTGPEIWNQTKGQVDAVVFSAGTGGMIAGVSKYLKERNPKVKAYLIDPPGSGLHNRVVHGVCYSKEVAEGKRKRHQVDSITEGIGINRLTNNFLQAHLDGSFQGTDQEAVEMAHYLLNHEGLFVGSSSAINCVGAVRVAQLLGPEHVIVTSLNDHGSRHLTKFWNADYLTQVGLLPRTKELEFLV